MWILLCYISGSWSFLLQGNYLPQQDLVPLHLSSSLVVGLNVSATPSKVYLWIWFAGFWDSHAKVLECFFHFIWVLILMQFCPFLLFFGLQNWKFCTGFHSFLFFLLFGLYYMGSSPFVHCILNLHSSFVVFLFQSWKLWHGFNGFSNHHILVLLHLITTYQIYIFLL